MDHKKLLKKKNAEAVVTPTPRTAKKVIRFANRRSMQKEITFLIQLAKTHATVLTRRGFPPSKTAELEARLEKAVSEEGAFVADRLAARQQTAKLDALVAEEVIFRNDLHSAISLAAIEDPDAFKDVNLKLKNTEQPARLLSWFASVSGVVSAHQAALAVTMATDPVAALAAHHDRLGKALGAQTERQQKRGRLADAQKQARTELAIAAMALRKVAGSAFAGNKEVLMGFKQRFGFAKKAKQTAAGTTAGTDKALSSAQPAPATPAEAAASKTAPADPAKPLMN